MNTLTPEQQLEGEAFTTYVNIMLGELGISTVTPKLLTTLAASIEEDAGQKALYSAFSIGWMMKAGVALENIPSNTTHDSAKYAIALLNEGE